MLSTIGEVATLVNIVQHTRLLSSSCDGYTKNCSWEDTFGPHQFTLVNTNECSLPSCDGYTKSCSWEDEFGPDYVRSSPSWCTLYLLSHAWWTLVKPLFNDVSNVSVLFFVL